MHWWACLTWEPSEVDENRLKIDEASRFVVSPVDYIAQGEHTARGVDNSASRGSSGQQQGKEGLHRKAKLVWRESIALHTTLAVSVRFVA